MLTVIVCLVGSGKSSTRSPFPRRYSVIPSTEVTRTGFAGGAVSGGVAAAAPEAARAARMSEGRVFLNDFIRFLFPGKAAVSRWFRPSAKRRPALENSLLPSPGILTPAASVIPEGVGPV